MLLVCLSLFLVALPVCLPMMLRSMVEFQRLKKERVRDELRIARLKALSREGITVAQVQALTGVEP